MLAISLLFGRSQLSSGLVEELEAYLIYSNVIGGIAGLVLPPLAMRIWRIDRAYMWPVYTAALLAVAAAGSVVSVALLWLVRFFPHGQFLQQLTYTLKVATLVTLVVGVALYFIEGYRASYERTMAALRQKQLEAEQLQRLAVEARINSLESRLQPHFLFNTINSILSLIRENPRGAEEMLERLSRLLRFALDSQTRGQVPLGEELKLVSDYLGIERARFGKRLRFSVDAPADLHSIEVPPYSLQTLVENSMKYAIAPRREGGAIEVRARREDGVLCVEVWDDGPGFGRESLCDGHGLDTLEKRIRLLHGDAGALEVENKAGCTVRLRIPAGVAV